MILESSPLNFELSEDSPYAQTNRRQATPSVRDRQQFQINAGAGAGIITRELRFTPQLRSRGGGLSVMRALLVGITNLEQRRLREWPAHKLDANGQSVARESCRHAHCWKTGNWGEAAVVAGVGQVHKRRVGESVRSNDGWRVIVGRIHECVQAVVGHQLQYDLPGLFSG